MKKYGATLAVYVLLTGSCVTSSVPQPVASPSSKVAAVVAKDTSCQLFDNQDISFPHFVAHPAVVLTRIVNACQTKLGKQGWKPNSSWMAMGFPCTGGQGKVVVRGKVSHPKMVSFLVSNACPILPEKKGIVHRVITDQLAFPADMKLVAYYPFSLQYWELIDFADADTGSSVDLRNRAALTDGWKGFVNGELIHLRMYGRENAWVKDNQFFEVEAVVEMQGQLTFKIRVLSAKVLSLAEIQLVKERCEALRPVRNCSRVFPG